jgi:hypothetical protein
MAQVLGRWQLLRSRIRLGIVGLHIENFKGLLDAPLEVAGSLVFGVLLEDSITLRNCFSISALFVKRLGAAEGRFLGNWRWQD